MVSLKPHDIYAVRAAGKLTFTSLSGGHFRCHQIPGLGRLSRTDKESVIQQVGAIYQKQTVSIEPYIPKLFLIRLGEWTCIECKQKHEAHWTKSFRNDGEIQTCSGCHKKWQLTLVKSSLPTIQTAKRTGLSWLYEYLCPYCTKVNSNLVPGFNEKCKWCTQVFKVPK